MPANDEKSLMGTAHPLAALVCLFGFFLHIILSDPLLNALGFHYSGDEGHSFYERIHPGTVFIFISFFILLWDRGNPLRALLQMLRHYPAFLILLLLYVVLFAYLALRSGTAGTAFIIDTHMTVPLCALVLSYAPLSYCRRAAALFLIVAAVNSVIGIAESIGRFRIFTFDADWSVLHEKYFRASALRGHPLVNALFSSIAMFTALALPLSRPLKAFFLIVFTASLVAFGSRASLVFSVCGLGMLGIIEFRKALRYERQTMMRLISLITIAVLVPMCFLGFLALLLNSGMGDRLMAAAHWDESANSRALALHVFDHMSEEDILFGITAQRIVDITSSMNSSFRFGGIENPWLLMFMVLGGAMFPVWLMATGAFFYRLLQGQDFPLKLAIMAYIVIASTFNSFGVKDSTYLIMVCTVICAGHVMNAQRQKVEYTDRRRVQK